MNPMRLCAHRGVRDTGGMGLSLVWLCAWEEGGRGRAGGGGRLTLGGYTLN